MGEESSTDSRLPRLHALALPTPTPKPTNSVKASGTGTIQFEIQASSIARKRHCAAKF
jgi:hypothetical protein